MEYLCFLEGKRNYLFVPLSVSVCVCERKRVGSAVGKKSHNIQTENQILWYSYLTENMLQLFLDVKADIAAVRYSETKLKQITY